MKTIKTVANQTLLDVAVKYYGTAEAAGQLLALNPGLVNDPEALVSLGIDYLADNGCYLDVALAPGQTVTVDTDSDMCRQTVVKELNDKEINTFDGTDD